MYGFNLATYRARILREIEGYGGPDGSYNLPDTEIFQALNEAQRQVQETLHLYHKTVLDVSVVESQREYAVDPSTHGRRVLAVWFQPDASSSWRELGRIPYSRAYEDGLIQGLETGSPRWWCWDEGTPGRILVLPTPAASVASGLQVHIEASPRELWWIYDSREVALVNVDGSTGLILTDNAGEETENALVAAEHEIGIFSTDRSGRDQLPLRWYEIAAVATTHVTLTTPAVYGLAGTTGLEFMTAQVSDLERAHRGKLGFSMADLAAAILLDSESPERAMVLRARAAEILAGFRLDEQNTVPRGRRVARTPFFNG